MATYINDLRLKEISTGDESGTWGTSTNTNLELIGEALGYATQQVFGSDADATTTVADGASDPARAMYFKITSAGSLTATRTCTIAPNTVSRVMFIENATTGSQSIAISQGSGANVTIATGKTAVVYLDGAGSGAAVVDAMAGVDPGVTDTLTEVLVAGNTTGGTDISVTSGDKIVTASNDNLVIEPGGTGNVNILTDTVAITAAEGESASLILSADESDDNPDIWRVRSNTDNTLTIGNQISGSVVEHITITPNATVANSLASFAGKLTTAGVITAPSLDISGDIDVDGTSNLDILDVDGAANFAADVTLATGADLITASAGTSNLRLGVNAGNSIESGGNYNVVVGDEAGTDITTGDYNVAVGFAAGDATTTGSENISVGGYALSANTTGANNVGVGSGSLQSNTTASNNTAVGYNSLGANTTGTENTAIGENALAANTTGRENDASGRKSLFTNTTGSYNSAFGATA